MIRPQGAWPGWRNMGGPRLPAYGDMESFVRERAMPLRLWLVFEDPIITRVKSEALARSQTMGKLDDIALSQDVLRLENFCSPSVEEMLQNISGDEDQPVTLRWFDSSDGLESLHGILKYGEEYPGAIRGFSKDLRAFDKALTAAVKRKIRFRLQLDYRDVI